MIDDVRSIFARNSRAVPRCDTDGCASTTSPNHASNSLVVVSAHGRDKGHKIDRQKRERLGQSIHRLEMLVGEVEVQRTRYQECSQYGGWQRRERTLVSIAESRRPHGRGPDGDHGG